MNLDRDTHLGDIRVILLVENSIRYYSRYLPLLYTEVMTQTQELIFSEPQDNDMSIVMKIRVRPKVILATNYEEAVYVIDHYRENLIGVISDVRYKRNGEEDEEAGIELIRYVKRTGAYIPCMLQSQEIENAVKAEELIKIPRLWLMISRILSKDIWDSEILFSGTKTENRSTEPLR